MSVKVVNLPHASILINSMRSIGYDFPSAAADIVDNSISASAKNVWVCFPVGDFEEKFLEFIDDGDGMTRDELIEAMRFGSVKTEPRAKSDLGRFGLGLKTASISQCRKLTVVSKKNGSTSGFCWDLDMLEGDKDWNMVELDRMEFDRLPVQVGLEGLHSYTIVLWNTIDSLDKDVTLLSSYTDVFSRCMKDLSRHLALVFHRFIEDGLSIRVNGVKLVPVDPFLRNHPKTSIKPEQVINAKSKVGSDEKVTIQTYVLPYFKDLDKSDIERIGGDDELSNQGFYIYRNRRLMLRGTWFRIKPRMELAQNARIRVDIPNSLDDQWDIDIKKQKAIIPGKLMEQLQKEVTDAIETSKRVYKHVGYVQTITGSIWSRVTDDRTDQVRYRINQESNVISNLVSAMDDKSLTMMKRILTLVELSIPYNDIYNSIADRKEVNQPTESDRDVLLMHAYDQYMYYKKTTSLSKDKIIQTICDYEPFKSTAIKSELEVKING